jgi:DNA-binding LytR/AlgR family response regulator
MKNSYSCLIVEDEPLAQQVLVKFIETHPSLTLAGICNDALAAQQELLQQPVDILLLDIELPTLSGISLLNSISQQPVTIFTTAYPQYAVAGFELNAVDFLLKPFSFERFLKAINKAVDVINAATPAASKQVTSIFVKVDKKVYQLKTDDILYLSADDDYTNIVTRQKTWLVNDTLKSLTEQLPVNDFLRVHKSYTVAKRHIVFIESNYLRVADKDIPIGTSYKAAVTGILPKNK